MEKLLVAVTISKQQVISCWKNREKRGYSIKYKCEDCGGIREAILTKEKHCILRCNNCNRRGYITPIIVNDKIAGFNTYDEQGWKNRNKLFKNVQTISIESENNVI